MVPRFDTLNWILSHGGYSRRGHHDIYLDSAPLCQHHLFPQTLMAAASSRALNAILPQIPTAPYEAHQKARTFAARYVKSNQYDTAIDVLFQSARELFMNGQPGSGSDLTGFLLDVYETKGETVNEESRGEPSKLSPNIFHC